jgi:hypothetical protein
MDEQGRRQISAYFARFPQWTVAVLTIGIIIIVAAEGLLGYVVGIGALLASGTMGVLWFKSRPADAQMDLWLREDLAGLQPRALAKANLDTSELVRDNVVVIGLRFHHLGGAEFGFCRGGDGRARFTPVDTTVINFTEHQLVIYQCVLDLTTGKPLNECVDEYFYNDVVSVATRAEAFTYELTDLDRRLHSRIPKLKESAVNGKIQLNGAEAFILATSGGTFLRVVLNDPVVIQGLGGGELPLEFAEQAVQAVRKMLREKKAGALPIRGAGI